MAAVLYTIFFFNLLLVVVIKCLITCFHSSLPRNGRPISTRLNRQPEPVAARRGVKCFRVPAFAKACVPWRQPRIRLWLPRITQQCSSSLDRGKWRFSPSFFCLHPEHYLQFTGSKLWEEEDGAPSSKPATPFSSCKRIPISSCKVEIRSVSICQSFFLSWIYLIWL